MRPSLASGWNTSSITTVAELATAIDHLGLVWERSYPSALGALGLVSALIWAPDAYAYMEERHWLVENIYLCVFEVSLVFTAFCVTFYTFLITAESGFISRIRKSLYFRNLLTHIVRALLFGGLLTVFSTPMLVVVPAAASENPAATLAIALWFGLAVTTVAAFVRAARLFAIVAAEQH